MHVQMITPTALDWDRDGDLDLIVGDEDGRVALVEHTGEVRAGFPLFRQPAYFQQAADTLKFGALSTPYVHRLGWRRDEEDILCGNTAGNIAFFNNLGWQRNPKWAAPKLLEADGRQFRILAGPNGSIQGPAEAKWGYTSLSVRRLGRRRKTRHRRATPFSAASVCFETPAARSASIPPSSTRA